MKLTVAFMLVTLALCCYSASAALVSSLGLVSDVVPVPVSVLNDLVGGVQGCVTGLTPGVQSALAVVAGLLKTVV